MSRLSMLDYRAPLATLKQRWSNRPDISELGPQLDALDRLRPALERLSELRVRRERRRRRRVAAIIAALVLTVAVVAAIRYLRARATEPAAEPVAEEEPARVVKPVDTSEPDTAEADAEPVAEAVSG